jgi:hypothetical protein
MKYTVLDNTELYISRLNLDNTKSYYSPPCARAPPRSIWTGSHHIFSTTNWISPHIFEKDPKNKRVRFTCKVEEHQRINRKYGALKYPLPLQLWSTSCWRKICTSRQAHSKPNKLASHAKRFQDVPVNFPWKLTKDKVVKFQNLELAGWYQRVPYLRPQNQVRWHIATRSYLPAN